MKKSLFTSEIRVGFKFAFYILMFLIPIKSGLAQSSPDRPSYIEMIEQIEQRYGARIGLELIRCRDWRSLYCHRENELMTPASVVKTISTGTALRLRGASFRFSTSVYYTGSISKGVLDGDLCVYGSADPSIGSKYIEDSERFFSEVTEAITALGIKRINGTMKLYSWHPEQGVHQSWMLEDISEPYGAGLYGINYADNALSVRVSNPKRRGGIAITDLTPSGIRWRNDLRTGKVNKISIRLNPTEAEVRLGGVLRRGASHSVRLANPIPGLALGYKLQAYLEKAGVEISGDMMLEQNPYSFEGTLLHTYYSPTLSKLSHITNLKSQNLYAEAIGSLTRNKKQASKGEAINSYWHERLGLSSSAINIVDGSGLSRMNQITPAALALVLSDLMGGFLPQDGALVETLPEVGLEGTVRNLSLPIGVTSYLKSGTMRGVSCYAGYLYFGNEWYILAYMTNGLPSARISRDLLHDLLDNIFLDASEY